MDGTLFPLNTKPRLHGETYFTRKGNYCVHMLIVCDDTARIIYYIAGWPGSVHDNRVWKNCNLFLNCQDFFSAGEYILTDSAFIASKHVMPAFKGMAGSNTNTEINRQAFNDLLAKP